MIHPNSMECSVVFSLSGADSGVSSEETVNTSKGEMEEEEEDASRTGQGKGFEPLDFLVEKA